MSKSTSEMLGSIERKIRRAEKEMQISSGGKVHVEHEFTQTRNLTPQERMKSAKTPEEALDILREMIGSHPHILFEYSFYAGRFAVPYIKDALSKVNEYPDTSLDWQINRLNWMSSSVNFSFDGTPEVAYELMSYLFNLFQRSEEERYQRNGWHRR